MFDIIRTHTKTNKKEIITHANNLNEAYRLSNKFQQKYGDQWDVSVAYSK